MPVVGGASTSSGAAIAVTMPSPAVTCARQRDGDRHDQRGDRAGAERGRPTSDTAGCVVDARSGDDAEQHHARARSDERLREDVRRAPRGVGRARRASRRRAAGAPPISAAATWRHGRQPAVADRDRDEERRAEQHEDPAGDGEQVLCDPLIPAVAQLRGEPLAEARCPAGRGGTRRAARRRERCGAERLRALGGGRSA